MHRIKPFLVFLVLALVGTAPITAYADRVSTGSITSTQNVSVFTDDQAVLVVTITGTWTGTITPQTIGADGSTLATASIVPIASGSSPVTTITGNGQWIFSCAGYQQFRLLGNTVGSGTAVVSINTSSASGGATTSIVSSIPLPVTFSSSNLVAGPTSVTSATTVVSLAVAGYFGVGVTVSSAGSTCTQIPEVSSDGGTTWSGSLLVNMNTAAVTASTTSTGQYGIVLYGGVTNVRMRVSVYGSGTVTDQITATAASTPYSGTLTLTNYALETGGNLATLVTNTTPFVTSGGGGYIRQDSTATIAKESGGNLATIVTNTGHLTDNTQTTKITDGTTTANIAPASGSQTGQGAVQIAATNQTQSFSFGSATSGTTYDVSSYSMVSVQFIGNASANTISFDMSDDNFTTTSGNSLQYTDGSNNNVSTATFASATVPRALYGPLTGKYFRLRCSTFVGGTTTGTIMFRTLPTSTYAVSQGGSSWAVTQSGAWSVSPLALATGGYSFSNLAANATTTVKSGAGTLHSITINTLGTADTITVYDNTAGSGTKIATINSAVSQGTLLYDLAFSTGCTLVIAGTTPPDVSVMYK